MSSRVPLYEVRPASNRNQAEGRPGRDSGRAPFPPRPFPLAPAAVSSPAATSDPPVRSGRFRFVDGLRGLAAMWVVSYHLWENLEPAVASWFPRALGAVFARGHYGVEIFFVLSGFVIAHSVRNGLHTWGYLGRFALRRSIRLDPALWLTIAAEVVAILATLAVFPAYDPAVPSMGQILLNMAYLQRFAGVPDVVPVFWTLTYEVQFYFVLVLSLVVGRQLSGRREARPWAVAALALSSVWSAAVYVGLLPLPVRGLFIDRWYQFAVGVAVWMWMHRRLSGTALGAFFALLAAAVALGPSRLFQGASLVVALTAGILVAAVATDRLRDGLAGDVWQFLGRISYSLYLIHLTVGWRFVTLARDVAGPELGVLAGTLTLAGGFAVSVGAAWVLHRLVEAPTMRWARRVELPGAPSSVTHVSGIAAPSAPGP